MIYFYQNMAVAKTKVIDGILTKVTLDGKIIMIGAVVDIVTLQNALL